MDFRCFTGVSAKSTSISLWVKNISASQYRLRLFAIPVRFATVHTSTLIGLVWTWIVTTIKTPLVHRQGTLHLYSLKAVPAALTTAVILAGCSTSTLTLDSSLRLDPSSQWTLLPVANYTASPQAGDRMEAILTTLLQVRGVRSIKRYSPTEKMGAIPILDTQQGYQRALAWARKQNLRYGFTGSVEEWRYKSGVEREPAVGVSLRVVDIATGEVLWAASGARSGWGRETISGTAQKLLTEMLAEIVFSTPGQPNPGKR